MTNETRTRASAALAAALIALSLAGCAPSVPAEPSDPVEPLSLVGEWKQTNNDSPEAWQSATIVGDAITVYWVSDNGAAKALYWAGSYVAPTGAEASYSWDSANDTAQTSGALLASTDPTKTFAYEDGVLSYEVTALGVTRTATLEQVSRTPAAAPANAEESSDFDVSIQGATFSSDYKGKPVIVVTFSFTNDSDAPASFLYSLDAQAFQGGVELDDLVLGVEGIDDSLVSADVQPGTSLDVQVPFLLRDTSPVTVEVREFLGDAVLVTQEFSVG